jgi:hypothetical protein
MMKLLRRQATTIPSTAGNLPKRRRCGLLGTEKKAKKENSPRRDGGLDSASIGEPVGGRADD